MNTHKCPGGLLLCDEHPRWNIIGAYKASGKHPWVVFAPHNGWRVIADFPTHADAIAYATTRARATALAAIQDGAA